MLLAFLLFFFVSNNKEKKIKFTYDDFRYAIFEEDLLPEHQRLIEWSNKKNE